MQHVTEHTPEDMLLMDSRGRMYEIPADLLEQFEISQARLRHIMDGLPRDEQGRLQVPDWLERFVEDAEVEAQGRAFNLAGVLLLAAAGGCATPGGSVSPGADGDTCLTMEATEDQGGVIADEVCTPEGTLPLPAGAWNVNIADRTGIRYDGRIHLAPGESTGVAAEVTTEEAAAQEVGGMLECVALDNGAFAPATVRIRQGGNEVAVTSCGAPIDLGPGSYDVTVTLEDSLDHPSQTVRVELEEGQDASIQAYFEMSVLEVRFEREGRRVAGIAEVYRGDQLVGTMGSGVAHRVSAGTYDIVARYRTESTIFENVVVEPEQRRAVRASF